jgi:hypothetical protein
MLEIKKGICSSEGKRGVSPMIATIILIIVVLAIVAIIVLWMTNFNRDTINKFGEDIRLKCDESLEGLRASYSSGRLSLVNNANIGIFDFKVKETKGGSRDSYDLSDKLGKDKWKSGMSAGRSDSFDVNFGGAEEIELRPILLSDPSGGQQTWVCDEGIKIGV